MGNFNRGRSGGGRGFERRGGFSDRGSRGPVEMHQAVCDNCGKSCEVPFRPTSGKPIFCSSCFESNRGSDSRRPERSTNYNDRPMFDAVCADCGNSCKVPFQPSGEKPVFCSNCFGGKKGGDRERPQSQPQHTDQFEQLNIKLDRILAMLNPDAPKAFVQAVIDETIEEEPIKEVKVAKKKSSKKK